MDKYKVPDEQDVATAQPKPVLKKPYSRPSIIYRAPLEATASVCEPPTGKEQGACTTAFS